VKTRGCLVQPPLPRILCHFAASRRDLAVERRKTSTASYNWSMAEHESNGILTNLPVARKRDVHHLGAAGRDQVGVTRMVVVGSTSGAHARVGSSAPSRPASSSAA
jgi:hypothetical protein